MNYYLYALAVLLLILWYNRVKFIIWSPVLAVFVYLGCPDKMGIAVYLTINILLLIEPIRTALISKPLMALIARLKLMPSISQTEKIALRAGTVWMDGEIFSGRPNFTTILSDSYPTLTAEENAFLNKEVDEVCRMTNDYETSERRDLSPQVWQYLKDNHFLGMIIPKQYGGLGFSALGHSAVIQKLATHSQALAITTMVPNSLGPAELLLHYGTQAQRDYYLPRLANGTDVPCFALTEPLAGSDATSIRAYGIVFNDNGVPKIRLNFEKRYITLGAIASLIGLAFTLRDPDGILGKESDLGITCALVKSSLEGVVQGRRHNPLGIPFVNSPLQGMDVIIGIDDVIGGMDGIGQGWMMLMESLAVGRGISLPSTCTGGIKLSTKVCGAYATVREQFGTSIGNFEGIESVLGHMAAMTYMMDAARIFTIGAIDEGKKPSVINAVMKYHSTELFRKTINDAMDIVGGAGISLGERNLIGHAYMGAPIAITVEGANIMTRTLIQFGQGVIRCHPFAYKEIEALGSNDAKAFDVNFFAHIGFALGNMVRMILLSVTRGYIYLPKSSGVARNYERKLMWTSATFSFMTDLIMGLFGGSLKQREMISARFGDVMSYSYLLMATMRRYKEEGYSKDSEVFMKYVGDHALSNIQKAYDDIAHNLFSGILFAPLRFYMRLNRMGRPANDQQLHRLATIILTQDEKRDALTKDVYVGKQLALLEEAFKLHNEAKPIVGKMKKAIRAHALPKAPFDLLIEEAVKKSVISKAEGSTLKKAYLLKQEAIQVDSYDVSTFVRD
ncbi:MAG TPA: acyl-CoA dehydrogenase [Sulfuricurvum sp.]|nr:MAG: hypothetical protein B7Y30_00625 [Campylobacterales bacterium 16-40-21]OZA04070.1 MAG: hypothetical protein B7X89_00505 [Sulfuricurvum sp. 17-40-25]HQS66073.1 acyl-CoA dehydrogenase [Sulfuricurvum sp.]HQT35883.1 acyl-CoA dehydrogenase [Sulfuricurvum sp.]